MKKVPKFATEADLCTSFIAWVKNCSGKFTYGERCPIWTPYAETAGWDILLVCEDGTQIGIQAKLKFNMKVLHQSLPEDWRYWHDRGPDYRAVLIPERDGVSESICSALGLTLFAPYGHSWHTGEQDYTPALTRADCHWWSPLQREKLPAYVPDVLAGASGPVQLTDWKVKALRMVALLEIQGTVSRADFKANGVDPRRWTGPGGWLVPTGTPGVYARGTSLDFDRQHPTVYQQVLADMRAKQSSAVPLPADPVLQGALL